MTAHRKITDEHLTLLIDLVTSKPVVTIVEISETLGLPRRDAYEAVRQFRLLFGNDDTINLVCDPDGQGRPWLYRLTGTLDGADPWVTNRIGDTESRLETMAAVMAAIERATDGRSRNGRKARIIARAIRRAQEDLADLAPEAGA